MAVYRWKLGKRCKAVKKNALGIKIIFVVIGIVFAAFLAAPIVRLLLRSFMDNDGAWTLEVYKSVLGQHKFGTALRNSFEIAALSAGLATLIAFVLAYTCYYTNIPKICKNIIRLAAMFPMFMPTITYGFAIIYSFGNQGLLTKLLGHKLPFDLYGIWGLLIGYSVYTIPVAFLLVSNTMQYIDKKAMVVSKVMGDKPHATFWIAIVRPLLGTLCGAFLQAFFLSFTDFGIPASVGGRFEVVASVLYDQMLGGIPNFGKGAAVAMIMLLPSMISIGLLQFLEKYNIRYKKITDAELTPNKLRDGIWGGMSVLFLVLMLSIFVVIFTAPFVTDWPNKVQFSLQHVQAVFADDSLVQIYVTTMEMAVLTAVFGTLAAYGAALITARSHMPKWCKGVIEGIAMITNTIPGMVLGVAYMFVFSGSSLQNTMCLLVICNMIHYFSSPYLMMKNSLSKLNESWETTAGLMGDSWIKTIVRIVTPNVRESLWSVFDYYFTNSCVTVSAIIFLVGSRTMVLTTKIKQLQYINKFNEVFVLSLLIFFTNLIAKAVFTWLAKYKRKEVSKRRNLCLRKKYGA